MALDFVFVQCSPMTTIWLSLLFFIAIQHCYILLLYFIAAQQ